MNQTFKTNENFTIKRTKLNDVTVEITAYNRYILFHWATIKHMKSIMSNWHDPLERKHFVALKVKRLNILHDFIENKLIGVEGQIYLHKNN